MRGPIPRPDNERFWSHVQTSDDCWIWTAARSKLGYGKFNWRRSNGNKRIGFAHRFAYELLIGAIPEGMVLDHIKCDNPPCVNPGHLEPKLQSVHLLRHDSISSRNRKKTHCINGHEFTPENTRIIGDGFRNCRSCDRDRVRTMWRKKHPGFIARVKL